MRKETLIRAATFLGGIYFFIEYLLPEPVLKTSGLDIAFVPISQGFTVLAVMAIGLGLINLVRVHGKKVLFPGKGRIHSLALLVGLVVAMLATLNVTLQGIRISNQAHPFPMLGAFAERIVSDATAGKTDVPPIQVRVRALLDEAETQLGMLDGIVQAAPLRIGVSESYFSDVRDAAGIFREKLSSLGAHRGSSQVDVLTPLLREVAKAAGSVGVTFQILLMKMADTSVSQKLYLFVFDGLFSALGSAMFALLGVYIASAAYRAFRIRSVESALMMSAAVIVILGQIPSGLLISESMPQVRQWLLEVPNSAAFRAIRLGAAIGGLLLAIRMWLSLESSSFERGRMR